MKLRSEKLTLSETDFLHYLIPEKIKPDSLPVIFLHGFTGSANDWLPIVRKLDEHFYPVLPDLPGHGKTSVSEDFFATGAQVSTLSSLMKKLKIEKTFFVGYSMGGRLALQFATRYPEKMSGLLLENSSCGLADPTEREERVVADNSVITKLANDTELEFLKYWLNLPIFESLANNPAIDLNGIIRNRAANLDRNGLITSLKSFGTGIMPDCSEKLHKISEIPVLLVNGEHDSKYRKKLELLHNSIKSSELEIIKNAGHNTHLENPEEFIKLLNRFLINNC